MSTDPVETSWTEVLIALVVMGIIISTRILGWSRGHMQCAAGRASVRDLRKDQDGRPSRRQAPS
jgi:hypothetical protein